MKTSEKIIKIIRPKILKKILTDGGFLKKKRKTKNLLKKLKVKNKKKIEQKTHNRTYMFCKIYKYTEKIYTTKNIYGF